MKKTVFFLGKIMFLPVKVRKNLIKLGIKQSTIVLVKTLKNIFAANLLLFSAFLNKKHGNDYFQQRLGCAAPNRWWKYTTVIFVSLNMFAAFDFLNKGILILQIKYLGFQERIIKTYKVKASFGGFLRT